jgi:tripeptidyl-peptidase-1
VSSTKSYFEKYLRSQVNHSSTPESYKYGRHYTAEEVAEIFAPSQETVDAINDWLVWAGIAAEKISQSANKQWMQFDASAEELESLLNTNYHIYEHTETGKTNVACDECDIPIAVMQLY